MEDKSFFAVILSTLEYYVTEYAGFLNRPETITTYAQHLPSLLERVADTAGLAILLFFAAIGFLFWASKKYRNSFTFPISICIMLLLVITFGFPLFGLRNIIPSRWFVFMYFFLSIMAAFALLEILSRISSEKLRIAICFVSIFCLSFFMIGCTISNEDSPLWLEESTISTAYSIQEVKGADTLTRYSNTVFSDSRYRGSIIGVYFGLQNEPFDNKNLSIRVDNIFIWRKYMEYRPIPIFVTLEGYYKQIVQNVILGTKYREELQIKQKIYENDDVVGFYIEI